MRDPFTERARLDLDGIRATAEVATRLLDDVIDASRFSVEQQRDQAQGSRRIGLGMTGLADALIMLGLRYDEVPARQLAADIMRAICHAAYRTSIALAREKGCFPFFDRERYLEGRFIASLPEDIREGIAQSGIRNSHLTAIAPAGTIGLLANNISSGLEPVFAFRYERKVLELDGTAKIFELTDYAWRLWRELGGRSADLPPCFTPTRSHRVTTWRCKRRSSPTSTARSRRPSTCPRTTRWRRSWTFTGSPASRASRAARLSARTRSRARS